MAGPMERVALHVTTRLWESVTVMEYVRRPARNRFRKAPFDH